ncbi:MAG: hypothetical protein WBF08_05240 [Candidatus Bathyarchaeia archaeon]
MKKIGVLKIDKDLFISKDWLQAYAKTIVFICRLYDVKVDYSRVVNSERKGLHFYIKIKPKIDAEKAVFLQFLLGDDSQRVDYCRARVDSGLDEWNKLYWVVGRRFKTVYKSESSA